MYKFELYCSVVPIFRPQADQLLSSSGLSAVDLLAKALAKAAVCFTCYYCFKFRVHTFYDFIPDRLLVLQGYTDIKQRSILSSMENYVTVLLQAGKPIYTPS